MTHHTCADHACVLPIASLPPAEGLTRGKCELQRQLVAVHAEGDPLHAGVKPTDGGSWLRLDNGGIGRCGWKIARWRQSSPQAIG